MINTILFDLDGTLLPFDQKDFIKAYFGQIGKCFAKMGLDPKRACECVWTGTNAMTSNDGTQLNCDAFWSAFAESYGGIDTEQLMVIQGQTDSFYSNDFDLVKSVVRKTCASATIVKKLARAGYTVALATNPIFPPEAVETRLSWVGLRSRDFAYVTHYKNSVCCKPSPDYYNGILKKIDRRPEQCLMVGNSVPEDMCARGMGMKIYLVNEFLENPDNQDTTDYLQGTIEDFEKYMEQNLL